LSVSDEAKNLAISVGNAINAAATLAAGAAHLGIDPAEHFYANVGEVVKAVLTEQAVALAQANFPEAEVYNPGTAAPEAPAYQPAAPAYQPAAAPAAPAAYVPPAAVAQPQYVQPAQAPAPIPGAADGDPVADANWRQFFAAVQAGQLQRDFKSARDGQWFDNRFDKKPNWPDFKVKAPKGQDAPAVWITDKKNPSWVAGELARFGIQ
jgi:hypothetical protein